MEGSAKCREQPEARACLAMADFLTVCHEGEAQAATLEMPKQDVCGRTPQALGTYLKRKAILAANGKAIGAGENKTSGADRIPLCALHGVHEPAGLRICPTRLWSCFRSIWEGNVSSLPFYTPSM